MSRDPSRNAVMLPKSLWNAKQKWKRIFACGIYNTVKWIWTCENW